ncbi:MAG: hypothetical protein QOJ03_80 [Frankiaceae bacterium]|jgi:hypothetical protein|nr:hypothetical protein [Frankiaceae bacterium]
MTRRIATHLRLSAVLAEQDYVLSRKQALRFGLTRGAIDDRLSSRAWQAILPSVYMVGPGAPSRRQMLIAALLFAGQDAAIDDVDACQFHGVRAAIVDPSAIRVVVPEGNTARSRGFVEVRRSTVPFTVVRTDRVRYLEPAAAVIAATRRLTSDRAVLALVSDAVQRRVVSFEQLMRAHVQGPPRHAKRADAALAQVGAGVRSVPEGDFRQLAQASTLLPPLLYNRVLRLPDKRLISPDALAVDAGLVHETNGRKAHRRDDLFEDMQERHDAMTEAGLIALHSSPRRIWLRGREVIAQFERVYSRNAGRGLPPGVELLPENESIAV